MVGAGRHVAPPLRSWVDGGTLGAVRALAYAAFGAPLDVVEVPEPAPPPGGAVVRVLASGLCRSDWHGWLGHDPDIAVFPHVPGHELAGVVESVGEGVDRAWVGRRVTSPFVMACGRCDVCRSGAGQVCPHQRQPGFTDPGSFAELVVVHAAATNLVELPDELDIKAAAGLGCRVATAYRAVVGRAGVRRARPSSSWAAAASDWRRSRSPAAVEPGCVPSTCRPGRSNERSTWGRSRSSTQASGRTPSLRSSPSGPAGGAAVSVDALGSPETCRTGILSLGRRGRHVQVGLLPPETGPVDVPMDRVIGWELDVLGSHGMAAADYPAMLEDVVAGRLVLGDLLAPGEPIGLAEAGAALSAMGTTASRGIVLVDPSR